MLAPLHILLLRHGQTASNAGGIVQGHLPVPLNDVGHQQARQLAAKMAKWSPKIDALISSDLLRAMQTAQPISEALGLPIISDPGWRERGLGSAEGQTYSERQLWMLASGDADPPGAESKAQFAERVYNAIVALPKKFPSGGHIAVVSHGGPIRIVLHLLAEKKLHCLADPMSLNVEVIANGSILELRADGGAWGVLRLNEVEHLAEVTKKDAG
jgi:2,3-bisphosphoglycerate-dependent phosphoglycerate mutase